MLSILVESLFICPHCRDPSDARQYCKTCGKLVQIQVRPKIPSIISINQIVWVLIGGYSVYFLLRYFLPFKFTFILIISITTSFMMLLRVYTLMKQMNNTDLSDFFPNWKEFFFLSGLAIWISEIILLIGLKTEALDYILIHEILPFSYKFWQGFLLGLLGPIFFYYYKIKRK